MTLSCPQSRSIFHRYTDKHTLTRTLSHTLTPTPCTLILPYTAHSGKRAERCHRLLLSHVQRWKFCRQSRALFSAGLIPRCSQGLVLTGSRIPQVPRVASSTVGKVQGLALQLAVPRKFLDSGWCPCSGLKSPMIPATLVLPSDFGGPGLGDQPSHKPEGGRGRSCRQFQGAG